jgi:cob(I)alamin adenosyltransferase
MAGCALLTAHDGLDHAIPSGERQGWDGPHQDFIRTGFVDSSAGIALNSVSVRIYTRTGDDGTTGLLGRDRVAKDAARVEAYGCVDELNAALGVARALDAHGWLAADFEVLQSRLFQVGAELATVDETMLAKLARVSDADVEAVERAIDRHEAGLPPLTRFVVPGGTPLAAQLHFARTVCRRAERRLVTLAAVEAVEPCLLRYLNRVADLLFVLARWCNRRADVPETVWDGGRSGPA